MLVDSLLFLLRDICWLRCLQLSNYLYLFNGKCVRNRSYRSVGGNYLEQFVESYVHLIYILYYISVLSRCLLNQTLCGICYSALYVYNFVRFVRQWKWKFIKTVLNLVFFREVYAFLQLFGRIVRFQLKTCLLSKYC